MIIVRICLVTYVRAVRSEGMDPSELLAYFEMIQLFELKLLGKDLFNVFWLAPRHCILVDKVHDWVAQGFQVISSALGGLLKSADWCKLGSTLKTPSSKGFVRSIRLLILHWDPKVNDLDPSILDPEVIKLDVLVHEQCFVNVFKSLQHLKWHLYNVLLLLLFTCSISVEWLKILRYRLLEVLNLQALPVPCEGVSIELRDTLPIPISSGHSLVQDLHIVRFCVESERIVPRAILDLHLDCKTLLGCWFPVEIDIPTCSRTKLPLVLIAFYDWGHPLWRIGYLSSDSGGLHLLFVVYSQL